MAEGPIVKMRRDLALILMQNEFDIPVTASKILKLLNLDGEKFESVIFLLNKKKSQKIFHSLNAE